MEPHAMTGGAEARDVRRRLLEHFDRTARALPWRQQRTPYRVLVSEFMLQQTRVETVLPYYSRWLERFPDLDALAEATTEEVLREWQGLGYYSRARNLHAAARIVRDRFGGVLPGELERLRELPGVGEYTAGAVASIAFGRAVPAVDGNVRRVLARLYDLASPTAGTLRDLAAALVDPQRPGDFNEALMELGATVCTPRSPGCERCPVGRHCRARAAGTAHLRPAPPARRQVPSVRVEVRVLLDPDDRALFVRRPARGLLAGMWEFPTAETVARRGLSGRRVAALEPVRHAFSHLKATYEPSVYRIDRSGLEPAASGRGDPEVREGARWLGLSDVATIPLPVAQRRIAELVRVWLTTGNDEA